MKKTAHPRVSLSTFSTSPAPCSFVRVFHSFKNLRKSKMERKYHTQQSVSEEKMLWVG